MWLVGRDGDPELGRALAELVATGTPVELEMLPASYDLPGAALLDLVATMDRLRSPGGCPWDAEQTHESLTTYLLEETYETLEAIETGDRHHLREELGDLLLQVVFHSRIAEEHPEDAWSVDDVASDIVAKLVRRHPHVFGSDGARGVTTAADVEAGWHARKAAEKGRESAVEGVPTALPALALAAKLMHRAASHGVVVPPGDDDGLGSRLMELVAAAQAEGLDAEAELRAAGPTVQRAGACGRGRPARQHLTPFVVGRTVTNFRVTCAERLTAAGPGGGPRAACRRWVRGDRRPVACESRRQLPPRGRPRALGACRGHRARADVRPAPHRPPRRAVGLVQALDNDVAASCRSVASTPPSNLPVVHRPGPIELRRVSGTAATATSVQSHPGGGFAPSRVSDRPCGTTHAVSSPAPPAVGHRSCAGSATRSAGPAHPDG